MQKLQSAVIFYYAFSVPDIPPTLSKGVLASAHW